METAQTQAAEVAAETSRTAVGERGNYETGGVRTALRELYRERGAPESEPSGMEDRAGAAESGAPPFTRYRRRNPVQRKYTQGEGK